MCSTIFTRGEPIRSSDFVCSKNEAKDFDTWNDLMWGCSTRNPIHNKEQSQRPIDFMFLWNTSHRKDICAHSPEHTMYIQSLHNSPKRQQTTLCKQHTFGFSAFSNPPNKKVHAYSTFLLNEQPSVRRALPPVGWHNTVLQFPHSTTDWAWLKTVVLKEIEKVC